MKDRRVYIDYLNDILEALEKCLQFTRGMDFDEFNADDKTAYAVVRALEVVGEAVKQIPQEMRNEYPEIPWREMAGMRDKLIHEYFGVNLLVVWQTIVDDVPSLIPAFKTILQNRMQ